MEGSQGNGQRSDIQREAEASEAHDSQTATVQQPACVYSQLKTFSFAYPFHHFLFLRKGHKVTGFKVPSISILTAFMSQYTIMYCNYTKSKE